MRGRTENGAGAACRQPAEEQEGAGRLTCPPGAGSVRLHVEHDMNEPFALGTGDALRVMRVLADAGVGEDSPEEKLDGTIGQAKNMRCLIKARGFCQRKEP